MSEWQKLAERLVEIDFAIESLESWATEFEDVAELARLEKLRDDIHSAVTQRRISRGLRARLHEDRQHSFAGTPTDPRD